MPARRTLGRLLGATAATVALFVSTSVAAATGLGSGAPAFVVSAAPASLNNAAYAGEPSLGVNWRTDALMYMSSSSTYRLRLDPDTNPLQVSWTDVSSPYSWVNLDPILATNPVTGTTYAGGEDGSCAVMSKSSNDGESWSSALPCTGVIDHPTVGVGPGPGGTGEVAYFCQQYPILDTCSHSTNGGTAWTPSVPTPNCIGLFGHVKIARDGTAYIPSRNCTGPDGADVGGMVSTNGGTSWNSFAIPGAASPARGFDPAIGIDGGGSVYEAWGRNGDSHLVVARSHDQGGSWSAPVDLNHTVSPPLAVTAMPAVVAGDAGRVAVAYLGSRVQDGSAGWTAPGYHGLWDLYVSISYDGGRSWHTTQVTSDPVQRGSISDSGTTSTGQRNLLDFIDAQQTSDGRVVVAFADGCIGACAGPGGTEAQSTANWASVAVQTAGRSLRIRADH